MSSKRLWGGRFEGKLDPRIDRLNRSFDFDRRLFREDIEGSRAWAAALERAGLLSGKERRAIHRGLKAVEKEFEDGSFEPQPSDEDVHTAVERRLVELVGDPGRKLHTGRSRNDQVATDLHLWLKAECAARSESIAVLARALLEAAARAGDVAIPAYTHLQRAQPVLFAHHLLAYVEMLDRDRDRFAAAGRAADVMPLGCGAAVGTGFPIDRRALAKDLGFRRVARNSLDAVGSRDAALDFLHACAVLAVHLSRLGEEIITWASAEFGFVRLSDAIATGSSLLPQKRNPDGAELARGKAGRVLGSALTLATALKGLPLAYNKDLQEDKEALFDAADTVAALLDAMTATVGGLELRPDRCAAALRGGHLLATEIADYLVRKGVPFRTAHGKAGALVALAEREGVDVAELTPERMAAEVPEIGPDVRRVLTVEAALKAKKALGGTAPARVRAELRRRGAPAPPETRGRKT